MRLALAALLALTSAPVAAQDWNCDDFVNLPQQGLNYCLGERYTFWDGLLNNVYQQVIAERSPETVDQLRIAQRAWITYRDNTCDLEAARAAGGSAEPMMRFGCLVRLTERRTRDLENYLPQ